MSTINFKFFRFFEKKRLRVEKVLKKAGGRYGQMFLEKMYNTNKNVENLTKLEREEYYGGNRINDI